MQVLNDRILWIYFIVALFFIIIGLNLLLSSTTPYSLVLSVIWLFGHIALLFLVYYTSLLWSPSNSPDVCILDSDSKCFEPTNRMWLFVNVVYIALIIISLIWIDEMENIDAGVLRSASGIIMLLGGLLLIGLGMYSHRNFTLESDSYRTTVYYDSVIVGTIYLLIWFGLSLYVLLI
jgi:hypothetical protein